MSKKRISLSIRDFDVDAKLKNGKVEIVIPEQKLTLDIPKNLFDEIEPLLLTGLIKPEKIHKTDASLFIFGDVEFSFNRIPTIDLEEWEIKEFIVLGVKDLEIFNYQKEFQRLKSIASWYGKQKIKEMSPEQLKTILKEIKDNLMVGIGVIEGLKEGKFFVRDLRWNDLRNKLIDKMKEMNMLKMVWQEEGIHVGRSDKTNILIQSMATNAVRGKKVKEFLKCESEDDLLSLAMALELKS